MTGQKHKLETIKEQIANKAYPKFAIFLGERGSEQVELCAEVGRQLHATTVFFGNKVDDIREMIDTAYSNQGGTYLYVVQDADGMSNNAKNAMLKIAEEPPENTYIILLLEDIMNTLSTILSRGRTYILDPYSEKDLNAYCKEQGYRVPKEIISICSTPGELDIVVKQDMDEFIKFTKKTFENIHKVQGANAFKIAQNVNFSDDKNKYDLRLFWKLFIYFCYPYLEREGYPEAIKITLQSLRQLKVNGINKQMLFDLWILDIRECWLDADH